MRLKVVAVGVAVVAMLGACGESPVDRSSQAEPKAATQDTEVNKPKPEPKAVQEKAEPTIAEEQAMLSAQEYLDFAAFSRTGLIDQLSFEGFTQEQATVGVDSLHANWNKQAMLSAQEYLDNSSFSRTGLIDQLVFEGFTQKQATFGVNQTGL